MSKHVADQDKGFELLLKPRYGCQSRCYADSLGVDGLSCAVGPAEDNARAPMNLIKPEFEGAALICELYGALAPVCDLNHRSGRHTSFRFDEPCLGACTNWVGCVVRA